MKIRFLDVMESKNKFRVMCALFCGLVLLLAIPFAAHAQQYSGTITGTVTDPSGAAVAGANVTAANVGTNASYAATTSDLGSYTFAQLPIGTYEIHVKQGSFKEFITKGVEVHTSTVTAINAKLEMGWASEMVTVKANDVQVQTSSSAVGEVVEGTQLHELPLNGENFMQLVTLSPGVSVSKDFNGRDKGLTGTRNFSCHPNPHTHNLFLAHPLHHAALEPAPP